MERYDFTTANCFESYVRNPSGVDPNGYTTAATSHPDFSRTQAYDDNGNLTSIDDGAGNTRTLGYDPHNRLVAHTSTGGATASYLYDALGRRMQSTAGSEVTRFLYSGHRVIEERDDTGAVLASYVYGRGLDEVVSMQRDVLNDTTGAFAPDGTAEDYFYLGDLQNNTLVLIDADGQMVEAYAYGSELRPYVHLEGGAALQYPNDYGMPAILDENGAVLHADFTKTGLPTHFQSTTGATAGEPYRSRYGNPYLFNGRRWDAELGLYYYRNRHLDPIQGRFTSRDPIGIWGDSMNLGNGYSYVGNNPWTYVDPMGLKGGLGSLWQILTDPANTDPSTSPFRFVDVPAHDPNIRENVYEAGRGQAGVDNIEGLQYLTQEGAEFGVDYGLGMGLGHGVGAVLDRRTASTAEQAVEETPGLARRTWGRICAMFGRGADDASRGLRRVDPLLRAEDEARRIIVNGQYIMNPTAQYLADTVSATGKIGNSQTSGVYMYVVDEIGDIIIGSRAGQKMPHPTLIGGENPMVRAAGMIDIRGGLIYSVNLNSGHFKPGPAALDAAEMAFNEFIPDSAFRRDFQGFIPYSAGGSP